jgi:hypothetical protein
LVTLVVVNAFPAGVDGGDVAVGIVAEAHVPGLIGKRTQTADAETAAIVAKGDVFFCIGKAN